MTQPSKTETTEAAQRHLNWLRSLPRAHWSNVMSGKHETTQLVDCKYCGASGRRVTSRWEWEDTDLGPCSACDSTGEIEAERAPVEMEDLDAE